MASSTRAKEAAAQNRVEALRQPLRAKILRLLIAQGPSSPSKMTRVLAETVDPEMPAKELRRLGDQVNYHTKRLVELGCAELADEIKVRGAVEHVYCATERYLVETEEWEGLPPEIKEHLTAEFAQAHLDDMVLGFRAGTLGTHEHFHLTQTRILLDEQGRDELLERYENLRLEALEIEDRSNKRRQDSGDQGINMSSLLGCFEVPSPPEKSSAQKT